MNYSEKVEKWGVFEIALEGTSEGNPFTEREIRGTFCGKYETVSVDGFYDGNGVYIVRFMPRFEGKYTFEIAGNYGGENVKGEFEVMPAAERNHGPVHVANTFHFAYEDGTPYYSIGTTCYVWELQSDEMIEKTLKTLENSAFNKIRFCIFPKHYDYNLLKLRT